MDYKDGKPGGFDPHKRIPDMDADGIDAAFLYPSLGLFAGAIHDPELAAATCRAYNRWLADYCKPYPDRLFGIAMLPMQSVDLAIDEMRFAREELGFRGGFLRPNPYNDKMVHHPITSRSGRRPRSSTWRSASMKAASSGMPTVGVDRFEGRGARHIISHTMEMMLACMSVIWGGVSNATRNCASRFSNWAAAGRHPGSTVWTAISTTRGSTISGLSTRPSELFQRNCWISFEPVEDSLRVLADYIGPHKILWATDYPHPDGFFPGAPRMVLDRLEGLSAETRHQVMAGGAMGFYGLH